MEKVQAQDHLGYVTEEEESLFSTLLVRQEAIADKLESQEQKLRELIDYISVNLRFEKISDERNLAGTARRSCSFPFDPAEDFDVNSQEVETWARAASHDSRKSQLPQSYTVEEMQLRDSAMTATGSVQRRRFSEKSSNNAKEIPHNRSRLVLQKMVSHPSFEAVFAFIVLLNAVFIGIDTETSLHYQGLRPWELQVFNIIFSILFLVELILRLSASGRWFFCDENWMWNMLDSVIVVASVWDVVTDLLQSFGVRQDVESVAGLSGMKVFRFLRLTRVLKTMQFVRILRFVMALRTLVTSIFSTVKSLMWALLLLLLIVYIFAVIFVQVVNGYNADDSLPRMPEKQVRASEKHHGSLAGCMLSLFMSIANGVSWQEVLEPVRFISAHWVLLFLFFISFTEFAVLNVVTGVFCQSAIESAQHDQATMMQSMMANKETHLNKIKQLFKRMGADETGCITFAMFEDKINDPDVRAFFESLDLDIWDAWTFFKLLDTDGGGMVEVEEFFMGCLRFRGTARAMDVAKIIQDQRWLISHMSRFESFMESELNLLKEELLRSRLSSREESKVMPRLPMTRDL